MSASAGDAPAMLAFAPAKVNLTLRIVRRRADGYHDLESLVVFAGVGDDLRFAPGETLGLSVDGEIAAEAGDIAGNLVLKAAETLRERIPDLRLGHFHLTKRLPAAAGLGGGSSDAAAALRLLAAHNDLAADDPRLTAAACAAGADVPVCLDPRPRIMRGIGDVLSEPLDLPPLPAVLANPRIAVPTARVFAALDKSDAAMLDPAASFMQSGKPDADDLIAALARSGNDLEAPALALFPAIDGALAALRAQKGCRLARMSGSGATCFGLFADDDAAQAAAVALGNAHLHWWVRATALGAAPSFSRAR